VSNIKASELRVSALHHATAGVAVRASIPRHEGRKPRAESRARCPNPGFLPNRTLAMSPALPRASLRLACSPFVPHGPGCGQEPASPVSPGPFTVISRLRRAWPAHGCAAHRPRGHRSRARGSTVMAPRATAPGQAEADTHGRAGPRPAASAACVAKVLPRGPATRSRALGPPAGLPRPSMYSAAHAATCHWLITVA
jgi:hypothetical protein